MTCAITGRVYEKESGCPLVGLQIRAYDKDLFMDNLLGAAVTDAHGKFKIEYDYQKTSELFADNPDIYIAIFSATYHPITDTKDRIRWDASESEHYDIAIPHKALHGETYNVARHHSSAPSSLLK